MSFCNYVIIYFTLNKFILEVKVSANFRTSDYEVLLSQKVDGSGR